MIFQNPDWNATLHTLDDMDKTLAAIDQEIERLSLEKIRIRKRRNALVPVSRLPPEVLAQVFYEAVLLCEVALPRPKSDGLCLQRTIQGVCSTWRHVALDSPEFWSYIVLNSDDIERTSMCVRRSGQVSLVLKDLGMLGYGVYSEEIFQLVLSVVYRARSISLALNRKHFDLAANSDLHAPLLETLNVAFDDWRWKDETSLHAFHRAAWPRLRELYCSRLPVKALKSMVRPTLTLLDFSGHDSQPCTAWIALLRELSRLRYLRIAGIMKGSDIPTSTIPDPIWTVTLPHLEKMILDDQSDSSFVATAGFAGLVNHLILPDTCVIDFSSNYTSPHHVSLINDLYAAGACQGGTIIAVKPPRYIFFGTLHGCGMRMAIYTIDISLSTTNYHNGETLPIVADHSPQFTFAIPFGYSDVVPLIPIYDALPMDSVHGLGFCCNYVDNSTWEYVGRLENIHDIMIVGGCFVGQDKVRAFVDLLKGPAFLPGLRTLVLKCVTWNRRHRDQKTQHRRASSLMSDFIQALQSRADSGLRLEKLSIESSRDMEEQRMEEDVARLKELVGELNYLFAIRSDDTACPCGTCQYLEESDDSEEGVSEEDGSEGEGQDGEDQESDDDEEQASNEEE